MIWNNTSDVEIKSSQFQLQVPSDLHMIDRFKCALDNLSFLPAGFRHMESLIADFSESEGFLTSQESSSSISFTRSRGKPGTDNPTSLTS